MHLERKSNTPVPDLLRVKYMTCFAPMARLAPELGCSVAKLRELAAAHPEILGPPPAMKLQNQRLDRKTGILLLNSREQIHADRIRRLHPGTGRKAGPQPWSVSFSSMDDRLSLQITCIEPDMDSLLERNTRFSREPDHDSEAYWRGDMDYFATAYLNNGQHDLMRLRDRISDREHCLLEGDHVIIFLTPVRRGGETAAYESTRVADDPHALYRELKRREKPAKKRVQLAGAFYYIAISPAGKVISAFFDPWEHGHFWPMNTEAIAAGICMQTNAWQANLSLPLAMLEPLMEDGDVWGVDVFRQRRDAQDNREYSRLAQTMFCRYQGRSMALKTWQPTVQDQHRHEWVGAELPHVLETIDRPAPRLQVPPGRGKWRATISDFYDNRTGAPAKFMTRVRLGIDRRSLRVEFQCHDSDVSGLEVVTPRMEREIIRNARRENYLNRRENFTRPYYLNQGGFDDLMRKHNLPLQQDNPFCPGLDWGDYVELMIGPAPAACDCYHAGYYNILINSQGDLLERAYDPFMMYSLQDDWQSNAGVRVSRTADGWRVQIIIPLSAFPGIQDAGQTWYMNFMRMRPYHHHDFRREYSAWSPTYNRIRNPERFGRVKFQGMDFSRNRSGDAGTRYFSGFVAHEDQDVVRRNRKSDHLRGIGFADGFSGWAVGGRGTILHTTDQGETWKPQRAETGFILQACHALDEKNCVVVGGWPRSPASSVSGGMGIILRTDDAGESWQRISVGDFPWLYDVFFLNHQNGWAVGEYGALLGTKDGGMTWSHVRTTNTGATLRSIQFIDPRHGWSVGDNETIIRTCNGGRTWTRQNLPCLKRPHNTRIDLLSVFFVDHERGWAAGRDATLLRTVNGGGSWRQVNLPGLPQSARRALDFKQVLFTDERTGIILTNLGTCFLRTANGRTWNVVRTGLHEEFERMAPCAGQSIFAVGTRGSVVRIPPAATEPRIMLQGPEKPGWMYTTPHGHHLNGIAAFIAAKADSVDFCFCCVGNTNTVFRNSSHPQAQSVAAAAECLGMTYANAWDKEWFSGRRRAPGRVAHHYQMHAGLENLEMEMAMFIRFRRPKVVIMEWPILDEGYWAGDPGFVARAMQRAFVSAADPKAFPELRQLGLEPWQAKKLYIRPGNFMEFFNVHAPDTLELARARVVRKLGVSPQEAAGMSAGCWYGLLDRANIRTISPGPAEPVQFHRKNILQKGRDL